MPDSFIIVERDLEMKDRGVFTGQIQVIATRLMFHDAAKTVPWQAMDGVSSADIEHAFLFNAAATAWRFAMLFEPHWDPQRNRYWASRRWVARKDGDYFPGECKVGGDAAKATLNRFGSNYIPHEMIMAATADGYQQGRQSVLAEMGKTTS